MVYAQPRIYLEDWDAQTPLGILIYKRSPNLDQTTRPSNNQQEENLPIVDFAVPADHRMKLKESEKGDKYLDLGRESKKLEHESDGDTYCNWCTWYSHQMIKTVTWTLGNNWSGGDCPN